MQELGQIPQAPIRDPLEPTGFPGLQPKFETLPEPMADDLEFRIVRAGGGGRSGSLVQASDGVEFLYRGFRVIADKADGSLATNIFTLSGNVRVIGANATVVGERVTVNFENETYLAENAESQLRPALVGGQVRDDVYVSGVQSYGSERHIWAHDATVTTCNLPFPHFHIDARNAELRPGRRLILRNTGVNLFGRTILRIPYISVPLDDYSNRYLPEFGYGDVEGYFVRSRWGVPVRGDNSLDARLDYYTRLGTGIGGDLQYVGSRMTGATRVYTILGPSNSFSVTNDHRQDLGWGRLNLTNDYQRNNYMVAPGSTTMSTRGQLVIPQGGGASTRLTLNRNESTSGTFRSESQTVAVNDTRRLWGFQNSLDLAWLQTGSRYQGGVGSERQQLDLRLRSTRDFEVAQANLEYIRTIPIGETQGAFGGGDRTPFLALRSDTRRLFGPRLGEQWPVRTELSFGEFTAAIPGQAQQQRVGRYYFDAFLNKPDRTDKRFRASFSGQFRQGMYTDDTAQYTVGAGTEVSYRLGQDTAAVFRYNYLRPHGYSPLLVDRAGRSHLTTTDITFRPARPWLVGVGTGYDFLRAERQEIGWQQVNIRSQYTPRENFFMRGLAIYDTFRKEWSNMRFDAAYQHGDQFYALGARYDGIRKVWSSADLFMQNLQFGRTKLSTILTYNGFTKQFDTMQFAAVYDLHCAEAILVYTRQTSGFRAGNDVQIMIRLKALPFDIPFGFGRRGQPLGTPGGFGF
jgi:hypothetical protein